MSDPKGRGLVSPFQARDSRVWVSEEAQKRKIKREERPFFILFSSPASLFAPLPHHLIAWKRLGGFFLVRYNN